MRQVVDYRLYSVQCTMQTVKSHSADVSNAHAKRATRMTLARTY